MELDDRKDIGIRTFTGRGSRLGAVEIYHRLFKSNTVCFSGVGFERLSDVDSYYRRMLRYYWSYSDKEYI